MEEFYKEHLGKECAIIDKYLNRPVYLGILENVELIPNVEVTPGVQNYEFIGKYRIYRQYVRKGETAKLVSYDTKEELTKYLDENNRYIPDFEYRKYGTSKPTKALLVHQQLMMKPNKIKKKSKKVK